MSFTRRTRRQKETAISPAIKFVNSGAEGVKPAKQVYFHAIDQQRRVSSQAYTLARTMAEPKKGPFLNGRGAKTVDSRNRHAASMFQKEAMTTPIEPIQARLVIGDIAPF